MQGQFYLRRASGEDLPEIMRLMKGAGDWVPEPDWFAGDEEETVARHLAREGFILVAREMRKIIWEETWDFPGKSC